MLLNELVDYVDCHANQFLEEKSLNLHFYINVFIILLQTLWLLTPHLLSVYLTFNVFYTCMCWKASNLSGQCWLKLYTCHRILFCCWWLYGCTFIWFVRARTKHVWVKWIYLYVFNTLKFNNGTITWIGRMHADWPWFNKSLR